ncbi:MAG: nucleotidyltransferase domain-containing protein [Candidatus Eremiobacteraeota bacterium]|nr:nucleotidyltransferase domain-containing protein [Candidatus Eremiobacteraeota bacterium]
MAETEFTEKLKRYIDMIKEKLDLKLVILFGSYARGEVGKYSDIDLAVFVEEKPDSHYYDETVLLYRCCRDIDTKIEPHLFYYKDLKDHEPADFISEIIRTGNIIYGSI